MLGSQRAPLRGDRQRKRRPLLQIRSRDFHREPRSVSKEFRNVRNFYSVSSFRIPTNFFLFLLFSALEIARIPSLRFIQVGGRALMVDPTPQALMR